MTRSFNIPHTLAIYRAGKTPYKVTAMYDILDKVNRLDAAGLWKPALEQLEQKEQLEMEVTEKYLEKVLYEA